MKPLHRAGSNLTLVGYASSEESEPEEETSGPSPGDLFPSLKMGEGPALLSPFHQLQPPAPLPFRLGGCTPLPGLSVDKGVGLGLSLPWSSGLHLPSLGLPKPKKRTRELVRITKPKKRTRELVRITTHELHQGDSNSEKDETAKNKTVFQGSGEGAGLSVLLPQAQNLSTKDTNLLLMSSAFSGKPTGGSFERATSTPLSSAIKAAAKNDVPQVRKHISQEEDDSDEELAPENFSVPDKPEPPGAEPCPYLVPAPSENPAPGIQPDSALHDDAANSPLELKMVSGSSGAPSVPRSGKKYSSQLYNQSPTDRHANTIGVYYQDPYMSPDEIKIPPQPPGRCSNHLREKINKLYELKIKEGIDMNYIIHSKRGFRNPSIYEKLIRHCSIDELGTNYSKDMFDPRGWSEDSYYEALAKRQNIEMDKLENAKKKRKIEYVTDTKKDTTTDAAVTTATTASTTVTDTQKRKTRWNSAILVMRA